MVYFVDGVVSRIVEGSQIGFEILCVWEGYDMFQDAF